MRKRRNYAREFKLAAVKKVVEQGLSMAEVARDLSVHETFAHNWKAESQARKAIIGGNASSAWAAPLKLIDCGRISCFEAA